MHDISVYRNYLFFDEVLEANRTVFFTLDIEDCLSSDLGHDTLLGRRTMGGAHQQVDLLDSGLNPQYLLDE